MLSLDNIIAFVAGGALIWFFREPLTIYYKGAEDYIGILNDKINKLKP